MSPQSPQMEITKEIRYAVVMYGGVSLAIYINGVAQELFQLAKATATEPATSGTGLCKHLDGTASVYRRLAQLLSKDSETLVELEARLNEDPGALDKTLAQNHPIRVKFVIDTISGTSAGGINGIFLGKALARGQDIDPLKQLWIDQGDILKLLNDGKSTDGFPDLPKPKKPKSLLNGHRMYRLLVQALDGMEAGEDRHKSAPSGYVEDLDLFVTATDFEGLPVELRLADKVVGEQRYKSVFHFRHSQDGTHVTRDDFRFRNNPFLAFAARCTSSFPAAFEPTQYETTVALLNGLDTGHSRGSRNRAADDAWAKMSPKYKDADKPWQRFFCDGGYLDNKPFSYAIDAMSRHLPRWPGERKLIYIEPNPNDTPANAATGTSPNAIENVVRALTLAQNETIREDLERVLARNRAVERVERLLSHADEDVQGWIESRKFDSKPRFLNGDIDDLIAWYGPAYGGYHRLKVGEVTDEIGDWLAAALGYELAPKHEADIPSEEVNGLRLLVSAWRQKHFDRKKRGEGRETENQFLYGFDLLYRIRRLRFIIQRIDRITALLAAPAKAHSDFKEALAKAGIAAVPRAPSSEGASAPIYVSISRHDEYGSESPPNNPHITVLEATICLPDEQGENHAEAHVLTSSPWLPDAIRSALQDLRDSFRSNLEALIHARNKMRTPGKENALAGLVDGSVLRSEVWEQALQAIRGEHSVDRRWEAAERAMRDDGLLAAMKVVAREIRKYVDNCRKSDLQKSERCFEGRPSSPFDWPQASIELIKRYYDNYQGYDFVSFPVLYATDIGDEILPIDVLRISPKDAISLVNEEHGGRRKLAGTALHNFGAFLERSWRQNDMLWGRLDAAERLITTLLPRTCPKLAATLVREAQQKILEEHYRPVADRAWNEVASWLMRVDPASAKEKSGETSDGIETIRKDFLRKWLAPEADKDKRVPASLDGPAAHRELTPTTAAEALTRGVTIMGKVLEGIGEDSESGRTKSFGIWTARLGYLLWGLVEVATPKSMGELLGKHILYIAIIVGGILLALGWLAAPELIRPGWILVAIAIVPGIAVWAVRDCLVRRGIIFGILKSLGVALVLALIFLGALQIPAIWTDFRTMLCAGTGIACETD